jgi:serine/threonine protein kinase
MQTTHSESIKKGTYSQKSDVWSFAVTAFEVLSHGSTPYGRRVKTLDVARNVLKGNLHLQFPDTIGAETEDLLILCMDMSPEERPTFDEIVEKLDSGDAGEVVYADLKTFASPGADGHYGDQDFGSLRE